ncbi:MAG: COX15/CtaA family protein [Thermoproteota archaeon]|nr:COX15/CtaA family protein [Thermoproteota archaeon]
MTLLKVLSISTLFALFVLISIGGYVSASGVGLSCPDWPLCPAGLVPMNEFVIEYFHRTIAATTGLLVLATMIFTLKSTASRGMKIASIIAGSAVVGQIILGAFVIVERLHAVLVTAHLGLGLVLFSMVLIVVLYSYGLLSYTPKTAMSSTRDGKIREEKQEEHAGLKMID